MKKVSANDVPAGGYKLLPHGRCILGYGEATGHTHTLTDAQWLIDACEDIERFATTGESRHPVFVNIATSAVLSHQEHGPITLPAGIWQVWRQREYDPARDRKVID